MIISPDSNTPDTRHIRSFFLRNVGCHLLLFTVFVTLLYLSGADAAHAQISPMGKVICIISGMIYGPMGRGLAIIAVIILGISAMLGKASWGQAFTIAIGISVIFSSPWLVKLLTGNSQLICDGWGNMGA